MRLSRSSADCAGELGDSVLALSFAVFQGFFTWRIPLLAVGGGSTAGTDLVWGGLLHCAFGTGQGRASCGGQK
ncbi:hypothetical protein BJY01DRAFT_218464 [Aspergillus pseudoustus]|uniref:Uncharacterized protein n=1 Tax=Aspergillus pseudoustus TaxID=1810923 RepID=A0ABR4JL02_9EURO